MKEKQTKFLPPLPEVTSVVPRGIPFPSAMVACEQKLLCRTALGCAVRESTTLGDHLQPSNVGQCRGEMGRRQMCSSIGWEEVALNGSKSSWAFPGQGCDVEVPFLSLQQPHSVCVGIGALVLSALPSGWTRVLVQLREPASSLPAVTAT